MRELEDALRELEREQRRIASLPPDAMEQMAGTQRRTRDKAMELVREMKDAPRAADQQSPGGGSAPQPGQNSVQEAAEAMQGAESDLSKQDAAGAGQKQAKANRKLDEAKQQIEERLAQLRDETRQEKLARLEARFRQMLERQVAATLMTVEVDDRTRAIGTESRRERLLVLKLAAEEAGIAELGQQAFDLLLEDGTSVVFPEMVSAIGDLLQRAAGLLEENRTDHLTQMIQREIESSLQELLEALAEAKKSGGGGSGGGGGGGGPQPLLKKSAELKMLRARQVRINRQTRQLDRMRGEQPEDQAVRTELEKAARQQDELRQLSEKLGEGG